VRRLRGSLRDGNAGLFSCQCHGPTRRRRREACSFPDKHIPGVKIPLGARRACPSTVPATGRGAACSIGNPNRGSSPPGAAGPTSRADGVPSTLCRGSPLRPPRGPVSMWAPNTWTTKSRLWRPCGPLSNGWAGGQRWAPAAPRSKRRRAIALKNGERLFSLALITWGAPIGPQNPDAPASSPGKPVNAPRFLFRRTPQCGA